MEPEVDLEQSFLTRRQQGNERTFLDWMTRMSTQWQRDQLGGSEAIQTHIAQLAPQYGLDPLFVAALVQQESGYNPRAVSPKGAQGLMQLMPSTARQYRVKDAFDPEDNLRGGMQFLSDLQKRYPNRPDLQLAAYNAGPGAVDAYGGIPPYPETQQYVQRILGRLGSAQGPLQPGTTVEGPPGSLTTLPTPPARVGQQQGPPQATTPALQPGTTIELGQRLPLTPDEREQALRSRTQPQEGPVLREAHGAAVQRFPESIARGVLLSMESLLAAPEALGLVGAHAPAGEGLQRLRAVLADVRETGTDAPEDPLWIDRFGETVGSVVFSLAPGMAAQAVASKAVAVLGAYGRVAKWAGALTSAAIESGQEMGEVYTTLQGLLGEDEAQARAQHVFGKNLLLLTLTNQLGVLAPAGRGVARLLAGGLMEGAQEWMQYDISQRQFWLPSDAPMADQVRALGWQEQEGRLVAPVSVADQAQAAVFGMILGGGAAVATGGILTQPEATLPEILRGDTTMAAGFPQQPSPPTPPTVGGRSPTLREGAEGIPIAAARDAQGRWKIPLRDIPPQELELQDFLRQQGGLQLASETDVPGELRALITRKEAGVSGLLNDASGKPLGHMAEAAAEAGFTATPDKTALLEAMDRSIRQGQRVYSVQATGTIPVLHNLPVVQAYQALLTMAETLEERTTVQRRAEEGPRRRADVRRQAQELLDSGQWTLEDVREILPGTSLNDDMASVLVQQLDTLGKAVETAAKRFIESGAQVGSVEEQGFLQSFALLGEVDPVRLGAVAEAGRALGILNDPLSSYNQRLNFLHQVLQESPRLTSHSMAQKILAQERAQQRIKTGQDLARVGWGDMFLEAWVQGMLSGPQTWLVNFLSNTAVPPYLIVERAIAAGISHLPGIGSGDIPWYEPVAMFKALGEGVRDGWHLASLAARSGEEQFQKHYGLQDLEYAPKGDLRHRKAITAENLGLDPESALGKGVDFWAEYIGFASGGRLPGRVLMTQDELAKAVSYRIELAALAAREAHALGLSSAEARQRQVDILTAKDAAAMRQAAGNQAIINTFQQVITPERPIAHAAQQAANVRVDIAGLGELPLGRVVLPFLTTPSNLARFAMERGPLGVLFRTFRDDMQTGGARRDLALAKVTLGSLTMAAMAKLAWEGLLTGRPPGDPRLREEKEGPGWRPYSVYVPDLKLYIPYNRFDPFAWHLGVTADIVQVIGEAPGSLVQKVVGGFGLAFFANLTNRTYHKSLSRFFEAMSPKGYARPEDFLEGFQQLLRGQAGSLVPSSVATARRLMDPYQRQVAGWLEALYDRIAGWSKGLPYRRDKWGDPKLLGWGFTPWWVTRLGVALSPIQPSAVRQSPIDAELDAQQIALSPVPKTLGIEEERGGTMAAADPLQGRPLELTPQQHERYILYAAANIGELALLDGQWGYDPKVLTALTRAVGRLVGTPTPQPQMTLKDALDWVVQQPKYHALQTVRGPDGPKELVLRKIDHMYRQAGLTEMLKHDEELRSRWVEAKARAAYLRTPAQQQPQALQQLERLMPGISGGVAP